MDDRLYFRQLLAGRDFAQTDPIARQMVNFVYLVGDRQSGEAVVIDPAYDVQGLLDLLAADGMRLTGALATHYHPDHIGGSMGGFDIAGIEELLAKAPVPIHVQADEVPWITRVTQVSEADLVPHQSGDTVMAGEIPIELIHTPGHTPGSQCFLVDGLLVAGDTLFLEGCGRTDFPGSDPGDMFSSLRRLAALPDDTVLYPGHRYSVPSSATMAAVKELNAVYRTDDRERWLAVFGS